METASRYPALMEKLRLNGHRLTPQRMAILKVLVESPQHPSVDQVYNQIRADFPTTSLATVYKTIALLKDEGEIIELGFGGGSSRYDAARPYPHPHLICTTCQKIIDLDTPRFADLSLELAERYGFEITNQRIDFYGICPDCQSGNQNERKAVTAAA